MQQASIQFRCRKIAAPGAEKATDSYPAPATQFMKTDGDQDSSNEFESPTPEKPACRRSRIKGLSSSLMNGKQLFEESNIEDAETTDNMDSSQMRPSVLISLGEDDLIELSEEYKTLSVLFERMDSSIRLLALRKRLPTFRNISTQVEILSKRKFLSSHLAQMKYAFPEAIQIEKILIHDERSLCMIPEMKVTLVQDVIGCHLNPDQSASVALCKAFRARLLDFFKTHSEGTDIPQAALPEPFNEGNHVIPKVLPKGSSKELPQETYADLEFLSSASHFSSSFHQQFSQKIIPETEKIEQPAFPAPLLSGEDIEVQKGTQMKAIQCSVTSVKSPVGVICTPSRMAHQNPEITPAKYSSTNNAFMIETPSQQTPKRPVPSTQEKFAFGDEKLVTEPKLANSVRRSLILSPSKVDVSLSDPVVCTSSQDGVYACRKTTINRSISGAGIIGSNQLQVASKTATGINEDHNMSQSGKEKCHDTLACLPGMFDTICHILRSTDCSCITKQELVHKIILNNLDIEETREVEEQLQLLEELVPDWISKKDLSNGDCFYCIKQAYDRESVRARLVEAV